MSLQLYHNPRCSKSRAAFSLLEERGEVFETVLYLNDAPSTDQIKRIIVLLGLSSARDLMRKGESVYKELGLGGETDEDALVQAMSANPILIERPILLGPEGAAIGRPTENLLRVLD